MVHQIRDITKCRYVRGEFRRVGVRGGIVPIANGWVVGVRCKSQGCSFASRERSL